MSTLKTHNLQSPDAASVNIALAPNNGMVVAGISTFNNRVLIGTNIEGHADADDLTIGSSTNTAGITIRTNTAGTGRLWFSDGTSGAAEYQGYVQYDHNSQILALGSGGSTTLQIDQSGNVYFLGSQTGNNRGVIYNHASAFGIYASAHSGTDREIRFYSNFTSGSETLRIDSSGNIGVNQTNPSSYGKFVVNGTGNVISLRASSGAASLGFFEGGTGRFYIKTLNGSDGLSFVDGDNTSERLRITSGGNVQLPTNGQQLTWGSSQQMKFYYENSEERMYLQGDGAYGFAFRINSGCLLYTSPSQRD